MFSTVKKVSFYSPYLYATKVLLFSTVLSYVLLYNFIYKGLHLVSDTVDPSLDYRLRPSTAPCRDPKKWRAACGRLRNEFADLPYCSVSPKEATLSLKRDCAENRLQGMLERPNMIFVPTWIQKYRGPYADSSVEQFLNHSRVSSDPDNQTLWEEPEAKLESEAFVANAEMLMLELEHRLELPGGENITGGGMKAWFRRDEGHGPAEEMGEGASDAEIRYFNTVRSKVKKAKKDQMLTPTHMDLAHVQTPRVVQSEHDAYIKVSLRGLLRLANVDLDAKANEVKTWRMCGTKVILTIDYTNTDSWPGIKITPWSSPTPWYTVTARHEVSTCPSFYRYRGDGAFTRTRGVRLELVQRGELLRWSPWRAIVGLSTVLTLIGTAGKLLEFYLENCTSWYKDLKYERKAKPDDVEAGNEENQEEAEAHEEGQKASEEGQKASQAGQEEAKEGNKEPGSSSSAKEV